MRIEPRDWWSHVLLRSLEFALVVIIGVVWALGFLGAFYLLAWLTVNA